MTSENIACLLRANAEAFPTRRALVFPRGRDAGGGTHFDHWTYAHIDRVSDAYARGFRRIGMGPGTKTILMLRPTAELFAVVFGLFKIGAIPVIVDPGMGAKRMLHCYETVRAEAFVGIPLAHLVRKAYPASFRAARILVTVGGPRLWGGSSLDEIAEASEAPLAIEPMHGEDTLVVNFTTGSTGPARGVEYTHRGVADVVRRLPALYGETRDAVTFVTLPLFALFDMLLGVTAVLAPMDPTKPALVDARRMIVDINAMGATNMFASPAFLNRVGPVAARDGTPLSTLRSVVSGGAPVMPRVLEQFRSILAEDASVHATYGATEALPMASIEARELLRETRSATLAGGGTCAGYPTEGLRVRIVSITDAPIPTFTDGTLVGAGQVGEITVLGAIVSPRYHDDATSNALHKIRDGEDLWHRTGDLGRLDDRGRIWFCGRKTQRVVTAERTLFTVQCEGVFNGHPRVYRTALVGVGAPGRARPVVCVELRETGEPLALDELERELRRTADAHPVTRGIDEFLFHPGFPVDIRHNAKIEREKLAAWASRQRTPQRLDARVGWRAIPIAGWLFLIYGAVSPLHGFLLALWLVDLALSVGAHGLQLFAALPAGRRAGYSTSFVVANTLLFGATFWRALEPRELRGRRVFRSAAKEV